MLGYAIVFAVRHRIVRHACCWVLALLPAAALGAGGHVAFHGPHANPVIATPAGIAVANTPAGTLDLIDPASREIIARVPVGIEPVGLGLRPDGRELWVSNHVSDSVSVIDLVATSPTYLQVVATIQDLDPRTRATRFDEPVGIAFANDSKAYVALSSENQVAVVDVAARRILRRLAINAQDPRALAVRDGRLYVVPFESNNQTQISGCVGSLDGERCTFDAWEHAVANNNVLSRGIDVDIVRNPRIPDRDLFVFDTATDRLLETVSGVGTLLYGVAVGPGARVFVAQTDARNDANGKAGTAGHGLAELGNRAFLNQLTIVDCTGSPCAQPQILNLEPLPPVDPAPQDAVATPYGIALSDDGATLFVTAAGSDRLVTLDAASGEILGAVAVGAVPRGVALLGGEAWVLNAVANTVSVVTVADRRAPTVAATVVLEDPTNPLLKQGRIAFNTASASTTGTFSCESCHPDGHTDQLVWVLDTPACNIGGCSQIPPRVTMPARGLRDTAPYHWDGIPGDPYGGRNTANIFGFDEPNCSEDDPASCTRHLVDGALATTLCRVDGCAVNDEDKAGALSATDRDAMAEYLLSIPYPPAPRRAYTGELSTTARSGFRLFHIDGDLQPGGPNVCGDCHRMPFWVSTNTPGTGMEAPTWRGAYDRWLILPQGRLNVIDLDFYRNITDLGTPERLLWRFSWASRTRFDPVWNMVTEGSTGFAGAFGRQVTLDETTVADATTLAVLDALEQAADERAVNLTASGALLAEAPTPVSLRYERGRYVADGAPALTPAALRTLAADGEAVVTLTAASGDRADRPQPALWTQGPIERQGGRQRFPRLGANDRTLALSGRHVDPGAHVVVNGRRVAGNVRCRSGALPDCDGDGLEVQLATLPDAAGMQLLQLQNRDGLFSNDFIFHTDAAGAGPRAYDLSGPWFNPAEDGQGWIIEHLAPASPGGPERLVAYWYTFLEGGPLWLIGIGDLDGGIAELDVFSATGGEFPPAFASEDVVLEPWGTLSLEFADDTVGNASWRDAAPKFGRASRNIQRLGAIATTAEACRSGSYIAPGQDGHGFVLQVLEVQGEAQLLLSWYVFEDGAPLWLLGQGLVTDVGADLELRRYDGTDFPPRFDAGAVRSDRWGDLSVRFGNGDGLRVDWQPDGASFEPGGLDLVRLTRLDNRGCAN
ncbi:MAG: hypothetical protein AAGE01_11815 [Pseudomonadota bacterium]